MTHIQTGGGASVEGGVSVSGGEFTGRDKIVVQPGGVLHLGRAPEPPPAIPARITESSELVRNRYLQYDWNQPFDADEYRKSAKATSMLYENWLKAAFELDESRLLVQNLQQEVYKLEKSVTLLNDKLTSDRTQRWFVFSIQLIAVLCIGIGVNLITESTNAPYGWFFVGISVLLEILAYWATQTKVR